MLREHLLETHRLIDRQRGETYITACNFILKVQGIDYQVSTIKEAKIGLYGLFQGFLDADDYTSAAALIWGGTLFNPYPRSVQRIWSALMTHTRVLIPGGGSAGKSYTPAAWAVLNWVRDPEYTSGKVISVTASHATANVMSTIKSLHEQSALELPGRRMERSIDFGVGNKRAAIEQVSLPPGDDGKGRLRGFHPIIRNTPHPQFGAKSRIFALIDEGEDAAGGLWEGLENMLSTESAAEGKKLITIVSGANPKKRESPYAQRATPPGGWENFDIEKMEEWDGPESLGKWRVVRIDNAKSENVIEKREVYPGLMTYEGFMNYVRKGTNHPDYYTFARGAWPQATAEFNVTPLDFFNNSRGVFTFIGEVNNVASLDPAFSEGGDKAVMTTGRYGMAVGFSPANGPYHDFRDKPFRALQIEQQFEIKKQNTILMAEDVVGYLRNLKVRPEWFIMDKTGNGLGLYDALRVQFGPIYGQQWSEGASERKILEEDSLTAEERYMGVWSEMPFAFAIWLQYGYIKFAPLINPAAIQDQAIGRRYYYSPRGLIKVESKSEFKHRTNGISPDEYDSAIMLPHLIRLRVQQRAQMLPDHPAAISQDPENRVRSGWHIPPGIVDRVEFVEDSDLTF